MSAHRLLEQRAGRLLAAGRESHGAKEAGTARRGAPLKGTVVVGDAASHGRGLTYVHDTVPVGLSRRENRIHTGPIFKLLGRAIGPIE